MGSINQAIRQIVILPIRLYRCLIDPIIGSHCRFFPSCSTYAQEAIEHYGVWRGGWIALKRLCRCHPLSPGGVDFIPGATLSGSVLPKSEPVNDEKIL